MSESRIRTNEMTTSVGGDLIVAIPFTIEHESHISSPLAIIAILVSKPFGARKREQRLARLRRPRGAH
jgi:hypothetical protein